MEELALKSIALIWSGTMLSLGFWGGKKITNRIDEYLFEQSDEYKQLVKKLREEKNSESTVSL